MASSTLSLDSLSSPSPSPSPPPPQKHISQQASTANPSTFRPLDTDSELSELTDDDQDAAAALDKRNPAAKPSHSLSQPAHSANGADDDDDDPVNLPGPSSSRPARRGKHQRSLSARGGGTGRRKRSSIVPAPMWGWAESRAPVSTAPAEEEEEEDTTGPPRPMEEEEEEEEDGEDGDIEEQDVDDDDSSRHRVDSTDPKNRVGDSRGFGSQRRIPRHSYAYYAGLPPDHAAWKKVYGYHSKTTITKSSALIRQAERTMREEFLERLRREEDGEVEEGDHEDEPTKSEKVSRRLPHSKSDVVQDSEEYDGRPFANGDDDDGSASGSEYRSIKKKRPSKARAPTSTSKKRKVNDGDEELSKKKKPGAAAKIKDDGDDNNSDDSSNGGSSTHSDDGHLRSTKPDTPLGSSKTISNASSIPKSSLATFAAPIDAGTAALSTLAAIANAADPTSPPANEVASINAAAVSASIMAGASSLVEKHPVSSTTLSDVALDPPRSRSHTPDEEDNSGDESKPRKGKARPKANPRGGKTKPRGRPFAPVSNEKKENGAKSNGATPYNPPTDNGNQNSSPTIKKGLPPMIQIDTSLEDTTENVVAATGDDEDMDIDGEAEKLITRPADNAADVSMEHEEPEPEEEEEEEEEEDGEEEREESVQEEEEEADPVDGEAPEQDNEDAIEGEGDGEDNEGDGEDEQENENDPDAVDAEQDNEEGEDGDNDEDPSPGDADADVEDHDGDLQPAHRAEALDVLATIELKFALLRERVYVEKMEGLAWEEVMVQSATHPEMLHLQKELSQRRDKRLELASRKRSYEVANAEARRKADEAGVWSWWKVARDDLQTEMIAEMSRKRRRMERDRRTAERPQPPRRIPVQQYVAIPPPLPNMRKIVKSYPFGNRKHNKTDTHHHHHSQYPKNLVYPEISTLSAADIANDLDFLFQNSKASAAYDIQQSLHPHHHQQNYPPSFGPLPSRNGMGGMGMNRSSSLGIMSNGLPSLSSHVPPPPSMAPPHSNSMMHQHQVQHGMGYDQYGDISPGFAPPGVPPPGRIRDQMSGNSYPSQALGGMMPVGPPPVNNSRDSMHSYSNFPGAGGRSQQPPHAPPLPMPGGGAHGHGHGYPGDHELGTIGPGGPGNPSGIGHQIHPHHPYFGQNSIGPAQGNQHSQQQQPNQPLQPHMSSHHGGNAKGGMNGHRSVSPVPIMSNGAGGGHGPGLKSNGNWMGAGMGMPGFSMGGGGSKGGDWDPRMMGDEERERMVRERERERKREDRERDNMERERIRRDREFQDMDRERERERREHHMQQQHRSALPGSSHPSLSHLHAGATGGPPPPPPSQGSGSVHHHTLHHHHRSHHHHVVHHHHSQGSQHSSASLPPSGGPSAIVHSPRSTRDYESSRPPSMLPPNSGPSHPHPTEVITLSSGKGLPTPMGLRDRERESSHWSSKNIEDHHPSHLDFRDRDRDPRDRDRERERERERDRESRKALPQRHSSGTPIHSLDDRGDRPMAMPFVMASSQAMQQATAGSSSSHMNGLGLGSSTASPRGAPSWNTSSGPEDPSYRMPSSSSAPPPSGPYLGSSHEPHTRSPIQAHRYASTSGPHGPPLSRMPSNNPSSNLSRMASPPIPPPTRARPPPSPSYSTPMQNSHRSPVTSPKSRPLSPPPPSGSKQLLSGPPPAGGYSSSPRLTGPGRTSTPIGHHPPPPVLSGPLSNISADGVIKNGGVSSSYPISSRTASPLMSSLHAPLSGSGRSTSNGMSGSNALSGGTDRDRLERDRERHAVAASSPRLGPTVVHPPPSRLSA